MLVIVLPLLALLVRVSALASTEPYFSVVHPPLVRTRLDPIITPGKVSSHVHVFSGSSAITANATFESLTAGDCTTSFIQADKSIYWAPHLYYKTKAGELIAVESDGVVAYWKYARFSDDEEFAVVPDDFRMTAGNVSRNYYDDSQPSHKAISFQCVGNNNVYDEQYPYIPNDKECDAIRPQAFFPACWDGVHSYLDNNAHVTYPADNYEGGQCPDGWKRIPNLFLETYYHLSTLLGDKYEWYPGCLVLANGDVNGFSFHADWMNGWPSGMLVDAFNQCQTNLIGDVSACPVLQNSVDRTMSQACTAQGQIAGEYKIQTRDAIGGTTNITVLPGNNPIFNSSQLATSGTYTYPQHPDPNYVEQTVIVDIPSDGEGSCSAANTPRSCPDYTQNPSNSAVRVTTSNTTNVTVNESSSGTISLVADGGTNSSAVWLEAVVDSPDSQSSFSQSSSSQSSFSQPSFSQPSFQYWDLPSP
ncbi:hypothetical protein BCR39DRAFT_601419 [Naematelia encephala]|uniref:DUF1996 domain-containing protein n=1 Tax=Naematelia encephala TaxID=71784 RepID=A0A1Y2AED5_9TREE|nr:hypothetical protein BCR39DRAFT_601419 [Naematelia encephala]